MNIKLKAILQTTGIIACTIIGAASMNLILSHVDKETISDAITVSFISMLVYMMYQIVLLRLESREKISEFQQKYNKEI